MMISERANRSDESCTGSELMLPIVGNLSNSVARMLLVFCLLLPLNVGHTADGNAVRPSTTNLPAMNFAGEWKTREGTSPTISIVFSEERDRRHQVRINGKPIEMTGGRLPKPAGPVFFHFTNLNFGSIPSLCQFFNNWTHHLARPAPWRPKIHEDWNG